MDQSKHSLAEKLSGILAALKRSQRLQSGNDGSTSLASPPKTLKKMNVKASTEIDSLPDLLVFIKETSNPKVLRDAVARFLQNPLLSDNDRELVKKKVREKVEEEKRKKMESKKSTTDPDVSVPSASSSQHPIEERPPTSLPATTPIKEPPSSLSSAAPIEKPSASLSPTTSADGGRKSSTETFASPKKTSEPSTNKPQGNYQGSLLEKLKKLNNLDGSNDDEPEPEVKFDEWVPWPSKKGESAPSQEQQEVTVNSLNHDQQAPAVQQVLSDVNSLSAPPPMFQVLTPAGSQVCQLPPPGVISTPVLGNHLFAGFAPEAPVCPASYVFSERDRIPHTPTPPPSPPPRSPDPRLRPGAVVAAISDSGRLVMPGARAFRGSPFQLRAEATPQRGRLSPVRSTSCVNSSLPKAKKTKQSVVTEKDSKPEEASSESDAKTHHIHQYASRHKVSHAKAKKMIEEEERKLQKSAKKNSRRSRRGGKRRKEERIVEKAEQKNDVYMKGFEPLPKQKYAKNVDDTEEYYSGSDPYEGVEPYRPYRRNYLPERSLEEGEILDDSFDYGDAPSLRYPEFPAVERPRPGPYGSDRPPSLLDMMEPIIPRKRRR